MATFCHQDMAAMIPRLRRQPPGTPAQPPKAETFLHGRAGSREQFWDELADDTATMSGAELRKELSRLKITRGRDIH
jgi:hypothetical protein